MSGFDDAARAYVPYLFRLAQRSELRLVRPSRTCSDRCQGEEASRWIERAGPKAGAATVVFHSIVWQYMPPAEQAAVSAALRSHAARATRDAPFFWLRMEFNEAARQFELKLASWQGWDDRLLAVVHPHDEFALWR